MSPHDKQVWLQAVNIVVAIDYVALSVFFAAILKTLDTMSGRRSHLGPKLWLMVIAGSALFLFGCGVHHLHLALEMIPDSIGRYDSSSIWAQTFWHEMPIDFAQAVGAPLALVGGLIGAQRARKRVPWDRPQP